MLSKLLTRLGLKVGFRPEVVDSLSALCEYDPELGRKTLQQLLLKGKISSSESDSVPRTAEVLLPANASLDSVGQLIRHWRDENIQQVKLVN